jgi:hypothetical protein
MVSNLVKFQFLNHLETLNSAKVDYVCILLFLLSKIPMLLFILLKITYPAA